MTYELPESERRVVDDLRRLRASLDPNAQELLTRALELIGGKRVEIGVLLEEVRRAYDQRDMAIANAADAERRADELEGELHAIRAGKVAHSAIEEVFITDSDGKEHRLNITDFDIDMEWDEEGVPTTERYGWSHGYPKRPSVD